MRTGAPSKAECSPLRIRTQAIRSSDFPTGSQKDRFYVILRDFSMLAPFIKKFCMGQTKPTQGARFSPLGFQCANSASRMEQPEKEQTQPDQGLCLHPTEMCLPIHPLPLAVGDRGPGWELRSPVSHETQLWMCLPGRS